jgi:ribosomal protein L37AE/L43A
MIEMADIFRQYRDEYLRKYGSRILPSHRRAIDDIISCRTPALGGNLYSCPSCGKKRYSYHSCGNRHCPKCGNDDATRWVEKQSARIPEIPCFLITFTLPHELNKVVRSNQKDCYSLLFKASSASIKKLAADPRHLGAQPGMLGVLHTWGRDLSYHTHVHYLIPGGGIDKNGRWCWTPYEEFFLPVRALSPIYRGKFRDGMKALGLYDAVPGEVWQKDWVVHCESVGQGPEAIRYLSRYIYRVAITNNRIISLHDDRVTFRYQPVETKDWKYMTLPVLVFMARFLQHVLPKGFSKVRYYGYLHQRCTEKLNSIREQLGLPPVIIPIERPKKYFCHHCGTELIPGAALERMRAPP